MAEYIGVVHKDPSSDYGVSFPDFLGCITAGYTLYEAKEMAKEALQGHIDTMLEFGEPIPLPSSIDKIIKEDDEYKDTIVCLISISVNTPHDKRVRINIMLPEPLLSEIDNYASEHYNANRSAFLADAAKNAIQNNIHQ